MPREPEPINNHVIRRIFRMQQKKKRPVTYREIYMTSSRDKEEVKAALIDLLEQGVVTETFASEGRGQPTTYFHLTHEWKQKDPDFRSGQTTPVMIKTEQPNPLDAPTHRVPKETKATEELQDLMAMDDWDEFFQVIGPRMWVYVRDNDCTRDQLIKALFGSQPDTEARRKFVIAYGRLTSAAYDEFHTVWWIRQEQPKSPQTGMKDRRAKPRLRVNSEPPILDTSKKIAMEHAQKTVLIHSDATRESMYYPEPNDDIPDMSRFEATVKAISA